MMQYKEVWDKLSQVNVSDKIMKKNNLSYLSWAHCHEVMMEHFPEYSWKVTEYTKADGSKTNVLTYAGPEGPSAGVHVTVTIGNLVRDCFLPCMTGYSNKATVFPNARDINDAIQRCYVKACALFGLGVSLYWGEDIPRDGREKNVKPANLKIEKAPHKRVEEKKHKELEYTDDGKMKFIPVPGTDKPTENNLGDM
jgi:hypothetical protein